MKTKFKAIISLLLTTTISIALYATDPTPSDEVIKFTLASFLDSHVFPNIDTPELDLATHYSFSNSGVVSKKIRLRAEIPQTGPIKYKVYENKEIEDSELYALAGEKDAYLIAYITTQGETGFLGETGSIDLFTIKDPLNEDNHFEYPITLQSKKIGNIYFKLVSIKGDLKFTYIDKKCATHKYNDPVCNPKLLKNSNSGDLIDINGEEYKVKTSKALFSVTYNINAETLVKQGDAGHRKFIPKDIQLKGSFKFKDGKTKYESDLIYNPQFLDRG